MTSQGSEAEPTEKSTDGTKQPRGTCDECGGPKYRYASTCLGCHLGTVMG